MQKKRLQSPSSINTYKQCPRKYYYKYVLELPTKATIQQVRGKIAHSVLEDFFDLDAAQVTFDTCEQQLAQRMQELLVAHWERNRDLIRSFGLHKDQETFYFSETMMMLLNWLQQFITRLRQHSGPFPEAFRRLTPRREERYLSEEHHVQGFIDAIEEVDGRVHITDYKTGTAIEVNGEYRLQLGIYALLYHEKHGALPHQASVFFLRSTPKYIPVDESLLEEARQEIRAIHLNTRSGDIDDYPLRPGPLCRWCDFYKLCFEQKTVAEFRAEPQTAAPAVQLRQQQDC